MYAPWPAPLHRGRHLIRTAAARDRYRSSGAAHARQRQNAPPPARHARAAAATVKKTHQPLGTREALLVNSQGPKGLGLGQFLIRYRYPRHASNFKVQSRILSQSGEQCKRFTEFRSTSDWTIERFKSTVKYVT